ncbi:MAG: hypothetical protein JWN23_633 [Rhodocyclales bacterium]|nr:hypothetical protein [Rhodocyclales bacterium]
MTTVNDMKLDKDTVLRLAGKVGARIMHDHETQEEKLCFPVGAVHEFAALIQAELEKDSTVFGWLIEHAVDGHCLWLTASGDFVNDSNRGLRFARQEDAEAFLKIYLEAKIGTDVIGIYKQRLGMSCFSVSEHAWGTK